MATKNDIAKSEVERKIALAFGDDFIGVQDKKIYVWADGGGEKLQVAISMTCPKIWLEQESKPAAQAAPSANKGTTPPWEDDGWDFSTPEITESKPQPKVELSQEEEDNIAKLMERLGL